MNKYLFFSLLILSINTSIFAQERIKVLFVGNSYTFTNNLPLELEKLAESQNKRIEKEEFLSGGARFMTHWNNQSLKQRIIQGGFDFMVIQGQSQEVALPPSQFNNEVYPYAKSLDSLFKAHNPYGKVVFFMTWGYRYGDQSNCPFYPPFCTFLSMTQELYTNYRNMALDFHSIIAPVGAAWRKSFTLDSTYILHSSDNSHPSIEGTYLSACVIYSTLFIDSVNSIYYSSLNPIAAKRYQNIGNSIVLDSLSNWNLLSTNSNPLQNTEAKIFYDNNLKAIKIKLSNISEKLNLKAFNIKGQEVLSSTLLPKQNFIDTYLDAKTLYKGPYIIKLYSKNFYQSYKVIIL